MTGPLFREEALDHLKDKFWGEPLASKPLSFTLLAWIGLAATAAICAFIAFGHYERKMHVTGRVAPVTGIVNVAVPESGVLRELAVQEGQRVSAGDVLAKLSLERTLAGGAGSYQATSEQMELRRRSLLSERLDVDKLKQIELQRIRQNVQAIGTRLAALERELAIENDRIQIASEISDRYMEYWNLRFLPEFQAKQKVSELLEKRARHAELSRHKAALEQERVDALSQLQSIEARSKAQIDQIDRQVSQLVQDQAQLGARTEIVINAPSDGTVSAVVVTSGQSVQSGTNILALLPRDAMFLVELYVPTRAVGLLQAGQPVALRYQAFPFQKFGHQHGHIRQIGTSVLLPADVPSVPGITEPVYRVKVAIENQDIVAYGERHPLKAGMLLDASVSLGRRQFYEWILEPIYAVTGRS